MGANGAAPERLCCGHGWDRPCREHVRRGSDAVVDAFHRTFRGSATLVATSLVLCSSCEVTRDQQANDAWQAYGNDNTSLTDWTGGDGAHSVRLPDGRVVWMFGDTYLGRIYPTSPPSRDASEPSVANSFVIRRGDGTFLETRRVPLRPPPGASYNLWPRQGVIQDQKLKTFAGRTSGGAGALLVTLSLPSLQQESIQETPTANSTTGIAWGINTYEESDYVYLYGTRQNFTDADTYVARTPAHSLLGPWQYRTSAQAWSPNEADAAPVAYVGDGDVVRLGQNDYLMVGKSGNGFVFSPSIVGFKAPTPYGPFSGGPEIYRTPENDGPFLYQRITYATHFHPESVTSKGMLFSYSVCAGEACKADGDATVYRPRFLRMLP
jgi:hypothetical protein